ncbi:hypothetical protein [Leptospira santarosai]|uniref:Uncharacterized protein n=1 Tax=Leptospira santarosai serovar Shermani str. LT 821 TaxID=758847 RepID=K8XTU5_9LEPT|nr:hypothetical protein [Leptospira santarosai]EKT85058.2 hypothetical protein LSS_19498 [Leptospira santarosai serovar Shermani str. LT 821]EPG83098.1 hypothetical protein LEP1GSC048_0333 [Leptospira santarosai serovar Shermani str. 1342KT]
MIILKALIVFEILIFGNLLLAQQTIKKSESDLEKKVAQEVKKIREISGISGELMFELPRTSPPQIIPEPIVKLEKMGMAIIPFLLPYLSDTSEMRAVREHGNGNRRVVIVNEYIGYIINEIADHEFYLPGKTDEDDGILLGDEGLIDMDTIHAFQTLIANWYQKNKNKSPEERKREEYRLSLENKIKVFFKYYSDESEMIECATALGKIGNPKSAKTLRKVANYVSSYLFYKREATSLTIHDLFIVHEALAKLGHKKEALVRLNELKKDYLEEMNGDTQKKFLENLKKAEKW